jgi:hypothetical protein
MAGYNNYFPQTYTSTPNLYGANAWTQPTSNQLSAINWVQGEAGARSVPVPPGQKALLMDSESNVFYVKSSDTSGMPLPLRTFEYKEVNKMDVVDGPALSTYVTREEFEKAIAELKGESKTKEEKNNEFLI